MSRFDLSYDGMESSELQELQAAFKADFLLLEQRIQMVKDGRAKSLAFDKLEEAYMWIGKAIRDDQLEREKKVNEGKKK